MASNDEYTVRVLSSLFEVSTSTIYQWIKKGKLDASHLGGPLVILRTDKNNQVISEALKRKWSKANRTAYTPLEISDFSKWHEVLDQTAWLFKVCYSNKQDLKRKKFRLDLMFQNYITLHKVTLKKVKQVFASNKSPQSKLIVDDLKRGWYNELAYLVPVKHSTLGLSFSDITINAGISSVRFAFPSWKITTAYYAAYFFLRSLTIQKVNGLRIEEHRATISTFKNCLLRPLEKAVWKFPLDISYAPKVRVYRDDLLVNRLGHSHYAYSRHPRTPNYFPAELFEEIYKVFRHKSRSRQKPIHYTMFDFLLEFRIWANYQDIDNLLSLYGSGYKGFLDQNLSLLLFFIGGISELCFIAVHGSEEYVKQLQRLYEFFVIGNKQLEESFTNTAVYQRQLIYNKLGFTTGTIKLKKEIDINDVR